MKKEKFKSFSNVISIIAKIYEVIAIIGAVMMLLITPFIPAIINNIDINNKEINLFGSKLNYEINGHTNIIVKDKDKEVVNYDFDSKEYADKIIDEINSNSKAKIIYVVEVELILGIINICITAFVFHIIAKLFKTFSKDGSPFKDKSNAEMIKKIFKLSIAYVVVTCVSSLVLSIAFNLNTTVKVTLQMIIFICILYVIPYIFEYGYKLENKKEKKDE